MINLEAYSNNIKITFPIDLIDLDYNEYISEGQYIEINSHGEVISFSEELSQKVEMPNGELKFPRPYNQSFWLCEFGESAVGYDPNGDFEDYDYEVDISLNINDQDSNFFKNSWYEIVVQSLAKLQLSNDQ